MKTLIFQVEFKSNIVLPATSNTEGNIQQLDFIPGSNFLGMVAKNYNNFQSSFDVFHGGKVRFGDAHILEGQKLTYKIPFSYFHKKLESQPIYNHHCLEDEDFKTEKEGGLGQLKQLRSGYMTEDKQEVFVDYVYSQKSAYDKIQRRSLDSHMYGYKALKKGSFWQFVVQLDDTVSQDDTSLIIDTLENSSRLGKSKSAEYGQIEIKYLDAQVVEEIGENNPDLTEKVVFYCNSRLALVDGNGNPTYDLQYFVNGLNKENIIYDKCQIRTSTFTPYNGAMKTKSYERVVINKGSVIVLKGISSASLEIIKKGVGAYLSEGFGEILINPSFLMDRELVLEKECNDEAMTNKREEIKSKFEDNTVQFLVNRHNRKINTLEIANEVAQFVSDHKEKTFKKIKSSQWGNIRSIASSGESKFIEEINKYVSTGTKKWEEGQVAVLMNAINKHNINKQNFIKLLAMKMGGKNN